MWCGASSRAMVVGWYGDGVFSYTVDQDLTPECKARVAGWAVSLVASLDCDVSNMVRHFAWNATVGRFVLKNETGWHSEQVLSHNGFACVSKSPHTERRYCIIEICNVHL